MKVADLSLPPIRLRGEPLNYSLVISLISRYIQEVRINFFFIFRVVVWESAVLQVFNATNKCIASTQTDDIQSDEQVEEANITQKQDSVGTDSVPQRLGRPKYLRK